MFVAEIVFVKVDDINTTLVERDSERIGFMHADHDICLNEALSRAHRENRRCNNRFFAVGRAVKVERARATA